MNGQLHCNTGTLQVHTVVNLQLIVKCWTCYILTNVYLVEILVIPTVFGCYRYVSLGGEQLLSLVWYVCERERESVPVCGSQAGCVSCVSIPVYVLFWNVMFFISHMYIYYNGSFMQGIHKCLPRARATLVTYLFMSSQRFRTNSVSKIWFQICCHG